MLQKTSWWRKPPYNWRQKCGECGSPGSGASCASGARILQAEELAGVWAFPSSHGASALPGTHILPEFVTLSTALVISLPTQGDVWWLYPEGFCVDFTLCSFTAYLWLFRLTPECPSCTSSEPPSLWPSACLVAQSFPLFMTLWTVAHQAPLSSRFSRQKYWSGYPFPSPGDPPDPGIEPRSPALQDSLPSEPPGKPIAWWGFSICNSHK